MRKDKNKKVLILSISALTLLLLGAVMVVVDMNKRAGNYGIDPVMFDRNAWNEKATLAVKPGMAQYLVENKGRLLVGKTTGDVLPMLGEPLNGRDSSGYHYELGVVKGVGECLLIVEFNGATRCVKDVFIDKKGL